MTRAMQARKRQDRTLFYCPNGHSQHYLGETDAEKVRREMQQKVDAAERMTEWLRGQAAKDAKAAKTAKAALKKAETRINAGVCPHCNRTFSQLARHMQTKHPDVCAGHKE